MFFKSKHLFNSYIVFIFILLIGCQLNEAKNKHGIVFLENRAQKLKVNYTNTNDVINIFGQPHSKSFKNSSEWIYIERVLTKGEFLKLGQNVLKTNNVLILTFDKYGVLKNKQFIDKFSKNDLDFSTDKTENRLSQKSFVEKFLESLRKKMYKK